MWVVGALDQGTSSTRFMIFEESTGKVLASAQKEHTQYHPHPGWVEHDGLEILAACRTCIDRALGKLKKGYKMRAIGVTNQRETTIIFDKKTGVPACRAVSWNCARTVEIASRYRRHQEWITASTGLPVASYFSATKLAWLFESNPKLKTDENLVFGTIDTFLLFHLTGEFVTDVTNASRTLLCNVHSLDWDARLIDLFGIPRRMLARVEASIGGNFGTVAASEQGGFKALQGVPVRCVLGDQSAAAFGQCCFDPGDVKATFGTGAFVMLNTGPAAIFSQKSSGLLTTPLYQIRGEAPVYALEGAIAVAGSAVQWLRDDLGLAGSAAGVASLAAQVDNSAGLVFVPAFNGLFAPHWDETARGALLGVTSYADKRHVAYATLEAVAFQLDELCAQFALGFGRPFGILKVDGGMTQNAQLLQMCADIVGIRTLRPQNLETTAAGAAFGAALASDKAIHSLDDLRHIWKQDLVFEPNLDATERDKRRLTWSKAVSRSKGWTLDSSLPKREEGEDVKIASGRKKGKQAVVILALVSSTLFLAGFMLGRRRAP